MVNKSETKETKKRKSSTSVDLTPKVPKDDVYASVINYEEQEAKKRSGDKDAALFKETCDKFKQIINEVAELKKQQTPENEEDIKEKIEEKRIEGSLLFILLKKLNRLDKLRVRAGRDALHAEKSRVDSNKLQLHNLIYEAEHLKKEVQRCHQFKSQDEEIELVPIEEFYEKAPANISRPEKTKKDEHALRLARLEWELEQRKELDAQCKELISAKKQISKNIISKTERLDSLKPRLKTLLESTRPLQEALDLKIEDQWEVQKCVRLLPNPLYLLYANVTALGEACDPLLSTTINGDEEDAKQDNDPKEIEETSVVEEVNHDSDNDDNEVDVDMESGPKKRHHRQSKAAAIGQKRDLLFKPHPLSITITVSTKEKGCALAITFNYIPGLNIITTQSKLVNFEISGIAAGEVILAETLLNHLFPGDSGKESPNPRTKYQLEELQLSPKDLITILSEKQLGLPYMWAQKSCGLDFVNASQSTSSNLCETTIPQIIKHIRGRLQARVKLYKQILALEANKIDNPGKSELPVKISGHLVQWSAISFEEYQTCAAVQKFIETSSVIESPDFYYRAIITRGSAKMECYIQVPVNYPEETPMWALTLNWNGKHDSTNDSSIKEIEFIVNSMEIAKHSRNMLSLQLRKTMICLDVYLETEGVLSNNQEFNQEKSFLKAIRGRQRARPYKMMNNGGTIIYTQM
uniref:CSON013785 protein n=1 Tax=Culicoides sonorensis TaxID=179676 RepID=A0A336KZH7_CULSO